MLGTALAFIFTMTVADASRTMSPRIKVSDQGRQKTKVLSFVIFTSCIHTHTLFHTLLVLLLEAVVRRILVPHVVEVLFGDQPDYVRLVGQDRTIWYSFQAPPQVGSDCVCGVSPFS